MSGRHVFSLSIVTFLIAGSPLTIGAAERSVTVISDTAYTRPQRLVEIDAGRRLNIYCTGSGSPTVVFDSGLGDGAKAWGLVQPVIASKTRACSYDRAGLGFSDPSPRAGTSENIVSDLHQLLKAAGIEPPYVLVGHSFGGMNVKLYAATYPREVSGMVLVDPSHEDLGKALWELDPDYEAKYLPYMKILRRCLEASPGDFVAGSELQNNCVAAAGPRYSEAINSVEAGFATQPGRLKSWISEQENIWFASADQVRSARGSLGKEPILVLTKEPSLPVGTETQELRNAKNDVWETLHNQIAAMSSCGTRRVVANSGHYIQLDQPETVAGAILEVVHAVGAKSCTNVP